MARTSRKSLNCMSEHDSFADVSMSKYQTAIYTRLSKEDSGKYDSDSIENQVDIITEYIDSVDELALRDTYIDNGYTGVNFERPDFKRLVSDIELGKINCIVVKDLSRLGRDYISVGEYLYTVFPSLNVRVISINDNYDSLVNKGFDDVVVSLKNLVNASYSKDISKKVTSVLKQKQINGDFIGAYLYGYKKLDGEKNKLYIDENVSDVIVEIFNLRSAGTSFRKIAEILDSRNIKSPKKYLTEQGILNKYDDFDGLEWSATTVAKITKSQAYIGNMVQGKKKSSIFFSKDIMVDKKDWIVVENTHAPIISIELWNKVQNINNEKTNGESKTKHKENIFKGFLYCGQCGYAYERKARRYKSSEIYFVYTCRGRSHSTISRKTNCKNQPLHEKKLVTTLIEVINEYLKIIDYKVIENKNSSVISFYEDEIAKNEVNISKAKSKKLKLFEKYENDVIGLDDYKMMNENLDLDLTDLEQRNNEFNEKLLIKLKERKKYFFVFEKAKKYGEIKSLDKEVLDLLIDKIMVNDDNSIEIVWKFRDLFRGANDE